MKICVDCHKKKPMSEYSSRPNYNSTATKYTLSMCKSCNSKRARDWRNKNRERFNEYQRAYWHKNKK